MTEIKAVFFDLGDTITDLGEGRGDYEARVLVRAGRVYEVLAGSKAVLPERDAFCAALAQGTESCYQAAVAALRGIKVDEALRQVFEELGLHVDEPLVRASAEAYCGGSHGPAPLRAGAREVLAGLHSQGLRLGVISNTIQPGRYLDAGLATRGLLQYFSATVYSSELGLAKPHPGVFRAALERVGVRAENAVHVGDRLLHDICGAQRAGLRAVLIRVRGRAVEERADIVPDAIIDELPELPGALGALTQEEP